MMTVSRPTWDGRPTPQIRPRDLGGNALSQGVRSMNGMSGLQARMRGIGGLGMTGEEARLILAAGTADQATLAEAYNVYYQSTAPGSLQANPQYQESQRTQYVMDWQAPARPEAPTLCKTIPDCGMDLACIDRNWAIELVNQQRGRSATERFNYAICMRGAEMAELHGQIPQTCTEPTPDPPCPSWSPGTVVSMYGGPQGSVVFNPPTVGSGTPPALNPASSGGGAGGAAGAGTTTIKTAVDAASKAVADKAAADKLAADQKAANGTAASEDSAIGGLLAGMDTQTMLLIGVGLAAVLLMSRGK